MKFRKSAVAVALAFAVTSAQAFVEVPVADTPGDTSQPMIAKPKPKPKPKPKAGVGAEAEVQVTQIGDLTLGHGSAGLAVDPVSRKAYVTNYTSGTLSVIDVDTHVSEPHDVWVDRVPKKWGDKVLHVKRDASTGKDHWYIGSEQGMATGIAAQAGFDGMLPDCPKTLDEAIPGAHYLLVADMGHDLPEPLWPIITAPILSLGAEA